jgi:hypothetical protein
VFGEISFTHKISHPRNGKDPEEFLGTTVKGRVDLAIGRAIVPGPGKIKRRFQALLAVVEAKSANSLTQALPQLLVYLGSLHQSRQQRGRRDSTVYGVASDGFSYIFVAITNEGIVRESRRFELKYGDIKMVLGCLKYILEASWAMSPTVTPEMRGTNGDGDPIDLMADHSDHIMDIDHHLTAAEEGRCEEMIVIEM